MKLLPFWQKILWKSWSTRAAAFGGVLAAACGSLHAFDAIYPNTWGSTVEYWLAAAAAFIGIVVAPTFRVIAQNFGEDEKGNQIVSAIGVAPPGTSPTPAVVVSADVATTPRAADKVVAGTSVVG